MRLDSTHCVRKAMPWQYGFVSAGSVSQSCMGPPIPSLCSRYIIPGPTGAGPVQKATGASQRIAATMAGREPTSGRERVTAIGFVALRLVSLEVTLFDFSVFLLLKSQS